MPKNQLHQLLAVEKDLSNKATGIMKETLTTFTKKADHFDGLQKVYNSYDENGEKIPPEIKEVTTTVSEKMNYAIKSVIKAIDASSSKEETNAGGGAKAELVVDGTSFGTFSATTFLDMEKTLVTLRAIYKSIPTLEPTKVWSKEDGANRDVFTTDKEVKYRTTKVQEPLTLAPATDKHPAQVQLIVTDKQIGTYETVYKSGRITVGEKSTLLGRIDDLVVAVKKARAEANQVEVTNIKLGKKLFDFINEGVL